MDDGEADRPPRQDPGRAGQRQLAVRGADISFTPQVEAAGRTFTAGGRPRRIEHLLAEHGANYARLRVWVDPPPGYSDTNAMLTMAARVKARGMGLLLDPHYSDFWADPGKQPTPHLWADHTLAQLAESVRDHTRSLVADLARQGTPADMIQIGNEVTGGMLWPAGKVHRPDGEHWQEFCTLLSAGIAGAREGNPAGHPLRTMVHIDRGGDNRGCRNFFDHLVAGGVDFDLIGLSYYPFWHGTLPQLRDNLDDLASTYGKDIAVVETAYPWTLDSGDGHANIVSAEDQLLDGYPATPEGQARYFAALQDIVRSVPHGRGLGFFAWEPGWLPGVGWKPGAGNPNDNLTLFDWNGVALPALETFER